MNGSTDQLAQIVRVIEVRNNTPVLLYKFIEDIFEVLEQINRMTFKR